MQKYTYTLINKETPLCDFIIEGEGELEFCKIVKTYAPYHSGAKILIRG